MNRIFLIEDHDEAIKVWRKNNIKGLDLVHIDGHMDFGFYQANPIGQIFKEARSLRELKNNLEKSLSFSHYEKDFNKQSNIGNYIYPAMCEGIVRNFYWVIPGGLGEFKASYKIIKSMLKGLRGQDPYKLGHTSHVTRHTLEKGIISIKLLGRKFVICTLEKLPTLKQKVLLDIDTDFLVIDSLLNADNTKNIGKRKPWILPEALVKIIKKKIKQPEIITIAYSVNGGFTPMKYKHLGDEIAYRISAGHFKERYRRSFKASKYFELFSLMNKRQDYKRAISLNPSYRAADNNYGLLYLRLGKLSQSEKEFKRIARVDPKNPYPFAGLGEICLHRREFTQARQYFSYALRHKKNLPSAIFGLAQAELRLKNFKKAKELFCRYQASKPLEPKTHYLLGYIYEKEKRFPEAAAQYQDAMRLGLNDINAMLRLLKISFHIKIRDDIIKYVLRRYKEFKQQLKRSQRLNIKKKRGLKNLRIIKKKMEVVEKILEKGG
jgi:tetratricopeptide (TPR) repeat protein